MVKDSVNLNTEKSCFSKVIKLSNSGVVFTITTFNSKISNKASFNEITGIKDDSNTKTSSTANILTPLAQPKVSEIEKVIHDLRGGFDWTEVTWLWITIWMLQQQSASFQPINPPPNNRPLNRELFGGSLRAPRNYDLYKSSQIGPSLQLERPSAVPHQEYISLTKEQRRNLPHSQDGFICEPGHPELVVLYGQAKFKTPKHGCDHGLPTNDNDRTNKTD